MYKSELPEALVVKSDEEWMEVLDPESFHVLRRAGTERPFTGEFLNNKAEGVYVCKGCGHELFRSDSKFDSHCGWPSFYESINKENVIERTDTTHGMVRTEVLCRFCHGHLGHVFPDGPKPTGLRYCINGASLGFRRSDESQ